MLEPFIQQLGKELQMEEFITSPEPGLYLLSFDDQILVNVTQSSQNYMIKGAIGACPKENTETFLVKTMEANLFGLGTRGSIIGLNDEGNVLTLSLELDYNSTYKDFRNKLEDFVNVLDFWRQEANKHY